MIFSYIARNSATNVDESFIDKMLNELLAGKVIVNNPTHVAIRFYIGELFSRKRKRFTGTYYKTNRYYNTTEAEKLFSTDENKGNTKQKQKEHRDTGLNSYETLIVEIIELKGFVMEELYNVNKHFTDLSSWIDLEKHKEIAALREDCASKNYIFKILVEDLPKHTNSFYKVNQENNNPSYTDVNSQNDQPFVVPMKSIEINNKNTNRSMMLQETILRLKAVSVFQIPMK